MGARGARRERRQRQRTQTGTQDALVQYYDWAGCAVRRTWLRMGARGARRGRRQRQHTQTDTQDALVVVGAHLRVASVSFVIFARAYLPLPEGPQ